jgi:hypothetical protein
MYPEKAIHLFQASAQGQRVYNRILYRYGTT